MPTPIQCIIVTEANVQPSLQWTTVEESQLPQGDVTICVEYSSLNFKDALACQGHKGVIKRLPHVPGIDAAGVVTQSSCDDFSVGQKVLVTGYDLGQGHWGGWAEKIRVPGQWVVPIPPGLTTRDVMCIGTAGFTAAQSVLALQQNECLPGNGDVLVTGATGGVGMIAVSLLAQLGYTVVAVTGKASESERLLAAGAARVVSRDEITDDSDRAMLSARWAGAVDTVGGGMLNSILRSTKYGGCVTACGLVAGSELDMTVFPFLLRGISLCGIASADCPRPRRLEIWDKLAGPWKLKNLEALSTEIPLTETPRYVDRILSGQNVGRIVIKVA